MKLPSAALNWKTEEEHKDDPPTPSLPPSKRVTGTVNQKINTPHPPIFIFKTLQIIAIGKTPGSAGVTVAV
jgi:hypothetical protein